MSNGREIEEIEACGPVQRRRRKEIMSSERKGEKKVSQARLKPHSIKQAGPGRLLAMPQMIPRFRMASLVV